MRVYIYIYKYRTYQVNQVNVVQYSIPKLAERIIIYKYDLNDLFVATLSFTLVDDPQAIMKLRVATKR